MNIHFTPLTASDIAKFQKWLRQPHVLEFWTDPLTDEEIQRKYEGHIQSAWVFPYLIWHQDQPIGYIQAYHATSEGNGWWPNEKEGTYGMDLYIGEPTFLNRGLGSQVLQHFIRYFEKEHKVAKWIIDVSPENPRAIRCYEKAGFKRTGPVDTPDGKAELMVAAPFCTTLKRLI